MKTPKRKTTYFDVDDVCVLAYPTYKEMENTRWKRKNRITQLKRSLNKMQQVFDFQRFKINTLKNSLKKIDFMRTDEMTRDELAILLLKKLATALHVFELLDHQIHEVEIVHTAMELNTYLKAADKIAEELKFLLKKNDSEKCFSIPLEIRACRGAGDTYRKEKIERQG